MLIYIFYRTCVITLFIKYNYNNLYFIEAGWLWQNFMKWYVMYCTKLQSLEMSVYHVHLCNALQAL